MLYGLYLNFTWLSHSGVYYVKTIDLGIPFLFRLSLIHLPPLTLIPSLHFFDFLRNLFYFFHGR